jgi:hypothetical protein
MAKDTRMFPAAIAANGELRPFLSLLSRMLHFEDFMRPDAIEILKVSPKTPKSKTTRYEIKFPFAALYRNSTQKIVADFLTILFLI